MLEETEKFYSKTKLDKVNVDKSKWPVEYIHVFYKEYLRFPSVELPAVKGNGEFERLLKKRKSERAFSNKKVSLSALSGILGSCRIINKKMERRTYPSAGARYPIDVYLLAFRLAGLAKGAYHLNFSKFSLEQLLKADLSNYKTEVSSPHLKNPAGVIIFTSVISRSEVKYGLRAYPFSLIEAGHMAQNMLLSCAKYGIGACPIGGFINKRISDILDIDKDELPLYVIGFGHPKLHKRSKLNNHD